ILNDSLFSEAWVESRARSKSIGRRRLETELRVRGVDKTAIDAALDTLNPESEIENALRLAEKRARSEDLRDSAARRRVTGYLQRRGYSWEIIEQVFARLGTNSDDSP